MKIFQNAANHVYGRRQGRPLRVRKSQLMEAFLPRVLISFEDGKEKLPDTFFSHQYSSYALEVGFGGGEHLAVQARAHPDTGFIGCEPFINGVASLLDHLERDKIDNVRVFDDDARRVLDVLPSSSIDRCFVLFADPWPKKRHIERRFVGPTNLDRIARVLRHHGLLRVASDHSSLIAWSHHCLEGHPSFECQHASHEPPSDWIPTRYQEKALEAGRKPFFLDYRCVKTRSAM